MIEKLRDVLKETEAVIFDMDGTLVDSMWVWPAVDIDFYAKHNLVEPEGFEKAMEGKSYTEVAQLFLDTFPTLTITLEEIKNEWTQMAFQKYTTEVQLKKGAGEFLDRLKKQNIKLGIATSNGRELVDATLKALGIESYFDSVHTACEVKQGKPAPDIYLLVAEELEVSPSKCLVFEDVPMGILAGKNAGMCVCAVDDEYSRTQDDVKREMADYYIKDYDELKN